MLLHLYKQTILTYSWRWKTPPGPNELETAKKSVLSDTSLELDPPRKDAKLITERYIDSDEAEKLMQKIKGMFADKMRKQRKD